MCDDNYSLAIENRRAYLVVPIRQHTVNSGLKRFCLGKDVKRKTSVASIESWVSLVIKVKIWWWDVKASSPESDLLFSMLGCSFSFVQSLKSAIVSLI